MKNHKLLLILLFLGSFAQTFSAKKSSWTRKRDVANFLYGKKIDKAKITNENALNKYTSRRNSKLWRFENTLQFGAMALVSSLFCYMSDNHFARFIFGTSTAICTAGCLGTILTNPDDADSSDEVTIEYKRSHNV